MSVINTKISSPGEDGVWEVVADLTKVKKGGIPITELISRLLSVKLEEGEQYAK